MKLLDECKAHQGPVTPSNVGILENLTEKELLSEIGYLRVTVAPDICQRRREKHDGKFRMVKFSCDELRQSIQNAVKPESNLDTDIDVLLRNVLKP